MQQPKGAITAGLVEVLVYQELQSDLLVRPQRVHEGKWLCRFLPGHCLVWGMCGCATWEWQSHISSRSEQLGFSLLNLSSSL